MCTSLTCCSLEEVLTGILTLSTVQFYLWEGGGRQGWVWYRELAVLCSIGKSCPEKRGRLKKKKLNVFWERSIFGSRTLWIGNAGELARHTFRGICERMYQYDHCNYNNNKCSVVLWLMEVILRWEREREEEGWKRAKLLINLRPSPSMFSPLSHTEPFPA